MKKYLIFIISFFCIFNQSNAFFWLWNELDLYKNIDSWIDELEWKMISYEANWWLNNTWILKEINNIATLKKEKPCLDDSKNISDDDFKKIALEWNIEILSKYIKKDCSDDSSFSTTKIKDYLWYFNTHYNNSKKTSEEKSQKIYDISKIWLFSDWIEENSWFDLITDIEEIDKIIFNDNTTYYWEPNVDVSQSINWLVQNINNNWNNVTNYSDSENISLNKYKPKLYLKDLNADKNDNITTTENSLACYKNESSLSINNSQKIYTDINKLKNNKAYDNIIKLPIAWDFSNQTEKWYFDSLNILWNSSSSSSSKWSYSRKRDNSEWPCQDFFCINIEFVTYNSSAMWWNDTTIQFLLDRSNEHLKKFASTSLIPAKMTTNHFELWLKELNLPDIFHMAMQVSTKPIPILKIEDENKKDESEFASKNLLEKYYELNWLDYKRRNDLVLLNAKEQEKQSIINSEELTNTNASQKDQEYQNYVNKQIDKIDLVNKAIEKKVSNWVLDTFEEQYVELDKFTYSIYQYVEDLHKLIINLKEVPIDKW